MDFIQNDIIEPILLKLFLTDSKYSALLGDVFEKEWFHDEDYGVLIRIICHYFKKHKKLPNISTTELLINKILGNTENYKTYLTKFKSASNIDILQYDKDFLEEEVIKYLKDRGYYWTIYSNIDAITETHSVKVILDRLTLLSSMNFDMDLGLDYITDHDKHRDTIENPEARLSTGWNYLDFKTAGGWYKDGRCLCLFMGQTHIGKSLILSNIAANMLKQNKFVVVISLEMSQDVYATRVDAHLSELNINELKYNIDELKDSVELISKKHPNAKLVIKEYAPDTITCGTIKTYVDRITQTYDRKPDILLVDYLSLMLPEGITKNEGTYSKYRDVATGLRRLSYIFNFPVISVYQTNRDGYDNTDPSVANSSDSIGIPQTADFVGALYQNEGDKEAGIMNIALLKNRLGGFLDKIRFNIDYNNLKITDVERSVAEPDEVANEIVNDLSEIEDL